MNAESKAIGLKDERVLHIINRYISLKDADTARNNEILILVIEDIVNVLKKKNDFFREYYQRIEFVGSYYKGTKVGKPEEFDLNLIIRLPINYQKIKFEKGLPGFRNLKLSDDSYLPKWNEHSKLLSKWVKDDYLNQDKFRQWVESLFADMPQETRDGKYKLRVRKSGPAFTLDVKGPGLFVRTMNVDLVPVLEFKTIITPYQEEFGYGGESWFAVPKPFKTDEVSPPPLNWRPSFYIYEKNMLRRDGRFKPTIRQVKKLRDKENWKQIVSYHIETIFMHEIVAMKRNPALQKIGGIELFIHMLARLKEACETVKILNFWDRDHNLISHLDGRQLANIVGRLDRIIKDIKVDPLKIAEYLLSDEELREVKKELDDIRNGRDPDTFDFCTDMPSFSNVNKNGSSAEIMNMLKLIRSEMADTRKAVDELTMLVDQEFTLIRSEIADTQDAVNKLTTRMDKEFRLTHKEIADTKYQLGLHVVDVGNNVNLLQKHVECPQKAYFDKPTYCDWE